MRRARAGASSKIRLFLDSASGAAGVAGGPKKDTGMAALRIPALAVLCVMMLPCITALNGGLMHR